MDDNPLQKNTNVSRKPYVPPRLADLDSVPDTQGKPTNPTEAGTFAGTTS